MAFKNAKQRAAFFAIKNKMNDPMVTSPEKIAKPIEIKPPKIDMMPSDVTKYPNNFKRLKDKFKLKKV